MGHKGSRLQSCETMHLKRLQWLHAQAALSLLLALGFSAQVSGWSLLSPPSMKPPLQSRIRSLASSCSGPRQRVAAPRMLSELASMASELDPSQLTTDGLSRLEFLRETALSVGVLAGGFGAFRIGAAVSVVGYPQVPALKGPYKAVGVRYTRVRRDKGKSCRVKIFYPAQETAPDTRTAAPYCTDGRQTSDGMAGLVGFRQAGLSFLLAHLADAPSGCELDGPPADGRFPLLVYSHGMGGNFDMASYFLRQIASFGVVVAAVEHTDGSASRTVLENKSEMAFGSFPYLSRSEQLQRRAAELVAAAEPLQFPETLRSAINFDSVYVGGHSYGGPAALVAAAQSKEGGARARKGNRGGFKGLILHDPATGMFASDLDMAPTQPIFSIVGEQYAKMGVRCGATYVCEGSFHGNFVDAALWAPPWVMRPLSAVIPAAGPTDPLAIHESAASAAATFISVVDAHPGEGALEQIERALRAELAPNLLLNDITIRKSKTLKREQTAASTGSDP